jgi:hypothetical protein
VSPQIHERQKSDYLNVTTRYSDAIPYTAAASHLAPDTDIDARRMPCRNLPQICFEVSDKDFTLERYIDSEVVFRIMYGSYPCPL